MIRRRKRGLGDKPPSALEVARAALKEREEDCTETTRSEIDERLLRERWQPSPGPTWASAPAILSAEDIFDFLRDFIRTSSG